MRDVNGTPKVFPRKFARLLDLDREDDLIDAEFVMRCRTEGYPVVDVPVLSTRRLNTPTASPAFSTMPSGSYSIVRRTRVLR